MTLWLLGGHDPTHGAGLFRDIVTARMVAPEIPRRFGVTARTAQGGGRPARTWPAPAGHLRARVARWPRPTAIKVGLVPDALASEVADIVRSTGAPVVVDPVLRASDGGALGASPEGVAPRLAVATVITPNRPEAWALVGEPLTVAALGRRFAGHAVLLKDGHGADPTRVVDRLIRGPDVVELARPRWDGPDPRGTGCALATAIAAGLARGRRLELAVAEAVAWLDEQRHHCVPGPDGRAHLPDRDVLADP